ncbi:hypothetical protein ACIBJI_10800 [Nocardia sp. NPDC050408]|uniref:hypothetical protein n=1 Tax=Nocardia sp. NPDC050408 TaxID=3364319 RepID=UPI0037B4E9BA
MTDISPLANAARAKFGAPGIHAFVRSGRTVHAVRLGQWVGGEEVPELVCRTGVAGVGSGRARRDSRGGQLRAVPADPGRHLPRGPAASVRSGPVATFAAVQQVAAVQREEACGVQVRQIWR